MKRLLGETWLMLGELFFILRGCMLVHFSNSLEGCQDGLQGRECKTIWPVVLMNEFALPLCVPESLLAQAVEPVAYQKDPDCCEKGVSDYGYAGARH